MYSQSTSIGLYNLNNITSQLNKLTEQVSTGKRINSASDDSSGMTIANNLRSQANSLAQGTRNANDAKSLLNIVDGSLTSFKDTIDLMKNKALSASSDASSSESRNSLQKDIKNFLKSLNTIANNTSFNGIDLLNGTFQNKQFQVGAYAGQTVGVSISSVQTDKIGHFNEQIGSSVTNGTSAATLKINGSTISQATISDTTKDGANLMAEAINNKKGSTGVSAVASNSLTGGAVVGGTIADGDISINGVSIGNINIDVADNSGALMDAINAISTDTGVSATLDSGKLVLKSDNGENIHITEANSGAAKAGLTAGKNYGKITLKSSEGINIENATAVSGLNSTTNKNYTLSDLDVRTYDGAQRAMDILDNALSEVNSISSTVGATTNQLDRIIEVNSVTEQNVKAAQSTIEDADLTDVMNELKTKQLQYQASMFSISKAQEVQQSILQLLR